MDREIMDDRLVWLYSPGEGARLWQDNLDNNIMAIGWDELGDLRQYKTIGEIKNKLTELYPSPSDSPNMIGLALWEFCNRIKIDDYVIAKRGLQYYIGYGIVDGNYDYDDSRSEYKHIIPVRWERTGEWKQRQQKQNVSKTLTEISKYPDYCLDVFKQVVLSEDAYLLTWNPSKEDWEDLEAWVEDIAKGKAHPRISWRARSRSIVAGNRFYLIRLGVDPKGIIGSGSIISDPIISESDNNSGPAQASVDIQFDVLFNPKQHILPIDKLEELNDNEIDKQLWSSQVSGISIKPHILTKLDSLWASYLQENGIQAMNQSNDENYGIDDIFLDSEQIRNIIRSLDQKKNIILQGPPGVGKTFMAKKIARKFIQNTDPDRIAVVQFHQSYSYEDFVQGYRPGSNGGFEIRDGILLQLSARARQNPDKKYVLIIDEFNRGNIAKIFGELLSLIESDKRSTEYALSLTYSQGKESFHIPDNLYFIGLMNTADRSLAIVDYALRRRFAFFDIKPQFNETFTTFLIKNGVQKSFARKIVDRLIALNESITQDVNLGEGFAVGHSYFCTALNGQSQDDWYRSIIENEIAHLLREYWYDDRSKAENAIELLLAI